MTTTTPASIQAEARDFARQYPTANVLRGLQLAEAGRISWTDLHSLYAASLGDALATVASPTTHTAPCGYTFDSADDARSHELTCGACAGATEDEPA